MAKLLLCQTGMIDSNDHTAMFYALESNAVQVILLLVGIEEENVLIGERNTSLIHAIYNNLNGWKYLLRYAGKKGFYGTTALIEAARHVLIEPVKALLSEVGMCDNNGMTALMVMFYT